MKKFVTVIAVICIVFTGIFSYFQIQEKARKAEKEAADPYAAYEKAVSEMPVIDAEALRSAYPESTVIGTVNGKEITWGEYFPTYYSYVSEVDEYIKTMLLYYGDAPGWDEAYGSDPDVKLKDLPAIYTESGLRQNAAIDGYAELNGITLSEESEAGIDAQILQDKISYCGADATDEDFEEFLGLNYYTIAGYRQLQERNFLYRQMFEDLYGSNGEKISDEDGEKYLADNGYMAAEHILLMTTDRNTGETLSEDHIREKHAKAEEISSELRAIENEEERYAKLKEYQEEYNEDTGSAYYPDGYVFTSGTMVAEFEAAVASQKAYEVSEPVETSYGYHVIMTMPLNANAVISYTDSGTPMTAKAKMANEQYGANLQEYMDGMEIKYNESWKKPDLTDFMK